MSKPAWKKWAAVAFAVVLAVGLSGCRIPTNADGSIKLITSSTTFSDIMDSENWFNAIFVWPMAYFLNKYSGSLTVGGAIAVLTIVINAILLLLTMKSTVASQEMQMLQPEMQKIQRRYEGRTDQASQQRMAMEVQALYKKYDINPMSIMLVNFIQFPIIIAMYHAVQRSEAVKTGTMFGLDLSVTPLNGIQQGMWGYLVMFIVMGLAQFLAMNLPRYLNKKRMEEDAARHHRRVDDSVTDQDRQSRMMNIYMMIMILIFGLMWPSAMTLYWTINSLVGIVKTLIIQRVIARRAAERQEAKA